MSDFNKDGKSNQQAAELHISQLYQQLAHEQPGSALDDTILQLARNKQAIKLKPAEKPESFTAKFRRWTAPLTMAASVVLVGSVVLLQDWQQEFIPKRVGPEVSSSSGYQAPVSPQTSTEPSKEQNKEQSTRENTEQSIKQSTGKSPGQNLPQSSDTGQRLRKAEQQQKSLSSESQLSTLSETEQALPSAAKKVHFSQQNSQQGNQQIVPKRSLKATPKSLPKTSFAPGLQISTRQETPAPLSAKGQAAQALTENFSDEMAISPVSLPALGDAGLEQQRINVWLKEIDQLITDENRDSAIKQLKTFVSKYPNYSLSDKYKTLLNDEQ